MAKNDLQIAWKRSEQHERLIFYFLIFWSLQFFICAPFYLGEFQASFAWSVKFLTAPLFALFLIIRIKVNNKKVKHPMPLILIILMTGDVVLLSPPLVLIVNANIGSQVEHSLSGIVQSKWYSSSSKHTSNDSAHLNFYSVKLDRKFTARMKNKKMFEELKIGETVQTYYKKGFFGIYYQNDDYRGVVNRKKKDGR